MNVKTLYHSIFHQTASVFGVYVVLWIVVLVGMRMSDPVMDTNILFWLTTIRTLGASYAILLAHLIVFLGFSVVKFVTKFC